MKHLLLCLAAILVSLGAFSQEVVADAQPPTYLKFENQPFIQNGKVFGPIREVCVAVGINIVARKDEIELTKNDIRLVIPTKPGKTKEDRIIQSYSLQARTQKGITIVFVPLRTIAELFGMKISINGNILMFGDASWEITGKLIVIDREKQRIYAFEGLKQVYVCRTCTGKPGFTTPIGIFVTWLKSPGKFVGKFGPMYWPTFFNGSIAIHSCPSDSDVKNLPSSHGCCRVTKLARKWFWEWIPGKVPSSVKPGGYYFIPKEDQIPVYVIA